MSDDVYIIDLADPERDIRRVAAVCPHEISPFNYHCLRCGLSLEQIINHTDRHQ